MESTELHGPCMMRSIIIRIVLYKAHFDVYVTNAGDNPIRIVLDRKDVSGLDRRIHASNMFYISIGRQPHPAQGHPHCCTLCTGVDNCVGLCVEAASSSPRSSSLLHTVYRSG